MATIEAMTSVLDDRIWAREERDQPPDVHDGARFRLAADVRGDESWTAAAPFVTITPVALFAT